MELTPQDLILELKKPSVVLIDVREDWESKICSIEPCLKIPLGQLPQSLEQLAEDQKGKKIIFYCHHGVRSLSAALLARHANLEALSLKGGIALWAETIDPTCPKY